MTSGNTSSLLPPVAIGGVGGSGTRLIAEILRQLDFYMGVDLNDANDNLWFTLLFKRAELWSGCGPQEEFDQAAQIFRTGMTGHGSLNKDQKAMVKRLAAVDRPQHPAKWMYKRAKTILGSVRPLQTFQRWGWKEPNTHIFLDRLNSAFPEMKYIHVMRNGLDMAFSRNQNQLKLWGAYFFNGEEYEITPYWSLKYWRLAHRRVEKIAEQMPGRYLLLSFDAFCTAPHEGLRLLLEFLGLTVDAETEASLISLVRRPNTIGRFKQYDVQLFDPVDVAYVESLGFDVDFDGSADAK